MKRQITLADFNRRLAALNRAACAMCGHPLVAHVGKCIHVLPNMERCGCDKPCTE